MNLENLSNQELVSSLESVATREREITVNLLRHLIEFESKSLYSELGYSSLFAYCQKKLKLSDGATFRRITAARCLKENPEVEELLLSGKVTLCTLATASKAIEKKVVAVQEIVECSKREVESLVALTSPVSLKPKEVIKPLIVEAPQKREERVRIDFSVKKEVFEKFKAAQAELSVEAGKALSVEEVFERLLTKPRKKRVIKRVRVSAKRYIPKAVKSEVFERDKGQCCFVSKDGVRCAEKKFLHFDHIEPFAKGGLSQVSNLRLLCSAHNRVMAEREFGAEFIQGKIHFTGGVRIQKALRAVAGRHPSPAQSAGTPLEGETAQFETLGG